MDNIKLNKNQLREYFGPLLRADISDEEMDTVLVPLEKAFYELSQAIAKEFVKEEIRKEYFAKVAEELGDVLHVFGSLQFTLHNFQKSIAPLKDEPDQKSNP